jgi:hypothetical protein
LIPTFSRRCIYRGVARTAAKHMSVVVRRGNGHSGGNGHNSGGNGRRDGGSSSAKPWRVVRGRPTDLSRSLVQQCDSDEFSDSDLDGTRDEAGPLSDGSGVKLCVLIAGLTSKHCGQMAERLISVEQEEFSSERVGQLRVHTAPDLQLWEFSDGLDAHTDGRGDDANGDGAATAPSAATSAPSSSPSSSLSSPATAAAGVAAARLLNNGHVAEHAERTLAYVQLVDESSFSGPRERAVAERVFDTAMGLLTQHVFRMVLYVRRGAGSTRRLPVDSATAAQAPKWAEQFAVSRRAFFFALPLDDDKDVELVSGILRKEAFKVSMQQLESLGVTFVSPLTTSLSGGAGGVGGGGGGGGSGVGGGGVSGLSFWQEDHGGGGYSGGGSSGGTDNGGDDGEDNDEYEHASAGARVSDHDDQHLHHQPTSGSSLAADVDERQRLRQRQLAEASWNAGATPMEDRARSLKPPSPMSRRHTKASMLRSSRREDIKSPSHGAHAGAGRSGGTVGRGGGGGGGDGGSSTGAASGGSAGASRGAGPPHSRVVMHQSAWRPPMHFEGWNDQYNYAHQLERQKALAESLRRKRYFSKKHREPRSGEPALFVEVRSPNLWL